MSASAELVCVDPARINEVWPHVKGSIEGAFNKVDIGRFDELEKDVLNGDALLWLIHRDGLRAVVVTQIILSQRSKVCMVSALVGAGRDEWLHLERKIADYAKGMGCASMRMVGRRGWKRVLTNYAEIGVVLERRL
jgi:hypothetical protein